MSAEATVVRNFNDTRVGLPWAKRRQVMHDLPLAETDLLLAVGLRVAVLRPSKSEGRLPLPARVLSGRS